MELSRRVERVLLRVAMLKCLQCTRLDLSLLGKRNRSTEKRGGLCCFFVNVFVRKAMEVMGTF